MPNFTKKAIKDSMKKLLNERPLNQITVKDIVEDCGINRNSFYYHFEDMPSLIEEIVIEEVDKIIDEYPEIDSLEQCIDVAAEFAMKNRRAALHIYNSTNRSIFEHYLMDVCEKAVQSYAKSAFGDKNIDESDKKILMLYFKCECFGQVMLWMNGGMKDDIKASLHRLCELRRGMTEELLNRCTKN